VPRVVITGLGVISAIGLTRDAFWRSLTAGACGIHTINSTDFEQLRFKHAADVEGFVPENHLPAKDLSLMDRFAQFAVVAAKEAMAQSGLELTATMREDGAVVTGSCIGGRSAEEVGYRELYIHNRNRVHPLTIPLGMANAGASHISMHFGIQGPSYTISTACASSAHSIGQAFHMVRSGTAPIAIAGGSEAPLYFGNLKAWEAMRVISKDTCRPFSADRSGLVLRSKRRSPAAQSLSLKSSALACPPTPATLRSLPRRAPRAPCAWPCATLALPRKRSATSTPTAPQLR
jgi:nodulation protein E